jgi:hypothetical protein
MSATVGLVGCPLDTWFIQPLDELPMKVKLMVFVRFIMKKREEI